MRTYSLENNNESSGGRAVVVKVGFDCNVMVRTGCHKKVFRLPYLYLKKKAILNLMYICKHIFTSFIQFL